MFANFRVTENGLSSTKATIRHHRSSTGCYACRQSKKKCDEAKPICGRCRRHPSIECLWDARFSRRSLDKKNVAITAPIPPSPQVSLRDYLHGSNALQSQRSDAQSRQLELLLSTFNHVHSMSYVDPRISPLSLGITHAIQNPALMHAYAACGAAILSGSDPSYVRVSLSHYVNATRLVSGAIEKMDDRAAANDEWVLASINALHIFETLRKDQNCPNTVHLAGARHLYHRVTHQRIPETLFLRLAVQEFIFQLAISSTFDPSCFQGEQPYLEVHNLLRLMGGTDCGDNIPMIWKESSPLGVAHVMFDYIFRLSYLRLNTPLSGWQLIEAETILARLQSWQSMPSISDGNRSRRLCPPSEMILMADLYRVACLIFVHKILDTTLKSEEALIRRYTRQGVDMLNGIPNLKLKDTTTLIWPIFVLGIAATTPQERESCRRPLRYLHSICGIGCVRAVLNLLDKVWGPPFAADGESLGLDVLFRDDLLREVLF
ncbi:uncharacterized protein Z518_11227 [Rhinocladiella mackenziei CBS 650.93]|uniref:Zn(2)-C6 fungal-type domain-containing protein n=1 Tax=Rhinocladiella mackenziei CBS 650.93 TaxID=1442369 RepID=A0A0D2I1C1_9EURO|nr:uncharacterized protein Z518_11227 [Rhinocladiella mackenziei CBS 650.93]KIW99488.1 hypothetical protein Z518_11227 [Rhinocladiella mackenziei CBS 650.93]